MDICIKEEHVEEFQESLPDLTIDIKEEDIVPDIELKQEITIEEIVIKPEVRSENLASTKWFTCNQCDYKSLRSDALGRHEKITHPTDDQIWWYHCDKCLFMDRTASLLKVHKLLKHPKNIKLLHCEQCDYETTSRAQLTWHMKQHRGAKKKFTVKKWFRCEQCDYKSISATVLEIHVRTMHSARGELEWYHCSQCNFKTNFPNGLKTHNKWEQQQAAKKAEDSGWLQCDQGVGQSADCHKEEQQSASSNTRDYYKAKKSGKVKRNVGRNRTGWFRCDQCAFIAKSAGYLEKHKFVKHFNKEDEESCKLKVGKSKVSKRDSEQFQCDQCIFVGRSAARIDEHKSSKHFSRVNSALLKQNLGRALKNILAKQQAPDINSDSKV